MDRYSFSVGVNDYAGSGSDLAGCVNDALDWNDLLVQRGYRPTVMLDRAVTRDSFLGTLEGLVAVLGYRDRLVVTYSGHGSWIPDSSGDEPDARDEVLVMSDFSYVTDDDLSGIFRKRAFGSRIVLVSDSCHSGSVNRVVPRAGDVPRFLSPEFISGGPVPSQGEDLLPVRKAIGARSDALLLSGCHDREYSYDAWFADRMRYNGAFTREAIATYQVGITFKDWYARIRSTPLPRPQYPQTPQIDGSWHQRYWKALD